MPQPSLFLRIDFIEGARLGPGKVALLEAIARKGSIAAAARELGMGYRTAWLLIDSLNAMFEEPVITTLPGRRDGASKLTSFGEELVARFRRMEELSREAIAGELSALERVLK